MEMVSGGLNTYVKQFDDSTGTWVELGKGSATGRGVSGLKRDSLFRSLVLDDSGSPILAFSGNSEIYVMRYDDENPPVIPKPAVR